MLPSLSYHTERASTSGNRHALTHRQTSALKRTGSCLIAGQNKKQSGISTIPVIKDNLKEEEEGQEKEERL